MKIVDKKLTLDDKLSFKDDKNLITKLTTKNPHSKFKTKIVAWNTDTGDILFTRSNILTISGAGFIARSLFDFSGASSEVTPSYNNSLNLDNTLNTTDTESATKCCLFCVGYDGCGRENSQVYAEKYASWISPTDGIVPFQYRAIDDDCNDYERTVYYGRKTLPNYYAYYFKKFDSDPTLTQQLTDGTPIDSSIYDMQTDYEAETIISMQLSITQTDCRDYFIETTGINDCRINTISLCTAWKKTFDDGFEYYQDIRPLTRLNFPNESLIDLKKSITISYSIYI